MNIIVLKMKKERAVNGDECNLCTRPMQSKDALWVYESSFAMFTICDECKKEHEMKSGGL